MFKKPVQTIKIHTGTPQDMAGVAFGSTAKRVRQINVGFKKSQDDCPSKAWICHLVNEGIWAYVEVEYYD